MRSQPMFPGDGRPPCYNFGPDHWKQCCQSFPLGASPPVSRLGLSPMEIRSREVGLGVYVVDFLMFQVSG